MSELDSHPLSAHGHLRGISSLPPDNESKVNLVGTLPVLCYTMKYHLSYATPWSSQRYFFTEGVDCNTGSLDTNANTTANILLANYLMKY